MPYLLTLPELSIRKKMPLSESSRIANTSLFSRSINRPPTTSPNPPTTLAGPYERQGRYGEAEPLYRESLHLRGEVLGPWHLDTLASMNNLALLYQRQARRAGRCR